jgi:hypothetical protein
LNGQPFQASAVNLESPTRGSMQGAVFSPSAARARKSEKRSPLRKAFRPSSSCLPGEVARCCHQSKNAIVTAAGETPKVARDP